MKKFTTDVGEVVTRAAAESLERVDGVVGATTARLDTLLTPTRQSVAARYPTLFTLLGTFGAAATFLGFEQLLLASSLLERYPLLILLVGLGILALTGTLYKKLS